MAMFRELMWQFERSQGTWFMVPRLRRSSFSQEDLVSNLLGFYRTFRGVTFAQIETWCDVLTVNESKEVWRANRDEFDHLGRSQNWDPVFEDDTCGYCSSSPSFPSQFDITPAPEGTNWRKRRIPIPGTRVMSHYRHFLLRGP